MDVKECAIKAAMKAGALLKDRFGAPGKVSSKGDEGVVTELDLASDRLIRDEIESAFPDHGILSEESPEKKGSSPGRWIIDPLDGTTNYSHSFPHFAVSIAFEDSGKVTFGVVYDPMRDELFSAEYGKGAFLNGQKIEVSTVKGLGGSLIALDFPHSLASPGSSVLTSFASLQRKVHALRKAGSAALELCYVAAGRLDGYWSSRFHAWDAAAGALILEEAGGRITDLLGGPFTLLSGKCVATNGLIHENIVKAIS